MTTPFRHGSAYTTLRKSLDLGNGKDTACFDPSSGLVILDVDSEENLAHELIHVNQLTSTTAGIVMTALMAQRSAVAENFVRKLNTDLDAGLWVPIAGWLDDLNTGDPSDWYDPEQPYYYVSMMKRNIGMVDSALYSIGSFESMNEKDAWYWGNRFEWANLFEDKSWYGSFSRNPWNGGWWPFGITSLLEASALYLELLHVTGSILAANRAVQEEIDRAKAIRKKNLRKDPQFIGYFGPFLICGEYGIGDTTPPYHLVPIAAFWAMQAPLPHPLISPEIKSRTNQKKFPWLEVDPGNLFYVLFGEAADDLRGHSLSCSLRELASSVSYVFRNADGCITWPSEIIEEDAIFIETLREHGKKVSVCFETAFSRAFPTSLEARLDAFFETPGQSSLTVPIVSPTKETPSANAETYLLGEIAEHLIPLWSYGRLPRFRFGQKLMCPSAPGRPLASMCPASDKCNGSFPGVSGLPASCWFQKSLNEKLSLDTSRIGIVGGEYGSEEDVRMHNWA